MKIICTKEEKETLMDILDNTACFFKKPCPEGMYCYECIENTIEWEVTDLEE